MRFRASIVADGSDESHRKRPQRKKTINMQDFNADEAPSANEFGFGTRLDVDTASPRTPRPSKHGEWGVRPRTGSLVVLGRANCVSPCNSGPQQGDPTLFRQALGKGHRGTEKASYLFVLGKLRVMLWHGRARPTLVGLALITSSATRHSISSVRHGGEFAVFSLWGMHLTPRPSERGAVSRGRDSLAPLHAGALVGGGLRRRGRRPHVESPVAPGVRRGLRSTASSSGPPSENARGISSSSRSHVLEPGAILRDPTSFHKTAGAGRFRARGGQKRGPVYRAPHAIGQSSVSAETCSKQQAKAKVEKKPHVCLVGCGGRRQNPRSIPRRLAKKRGPGKNLKRDAGQQAICCQCSWRTSQPCLSTRDTLFRGPLLFSGSSWRLGPFLAHLL